MISPEASGHSAAGPEIHDPASLISGQREPSRKSPRRVFLFFIDGVGLGTDDPAVNPFLHARLPRLDHIFGKGWYCNSRGPVHTGQASLVPADACLGVPHYPQSATGQGAIITGKNLPALVGKHVGPRPTREVRKALNEGSLFTELAEGGFSAALLAAYPRQYFEAIESGRVILSTLPYTATRAGIRLFTDHENRKGQAVSADITGSGWHTRLGYTDTPVYTPEEAAWLLFKLSMSYDFSLFEHWATDYIGHRGTMEEAAAQLELLDRVLGTILDFWSDDDGLFILCSDHGNLEDMETRGHTLNPVPVILAGKDHRRAAESVPDLTRIAGLVRRVLGMPGGTV